MSKTSAPPLLDKLTNLPKLSSIVVGVSSDLGVHGLQFGLKCLNLGANSLDVCDDCCDRHYDLLGRANSCGNRFFNLIVKKSLKLDIQSPRKSHRLGIPDWK